MGKFKVEVGDYVDTAGMDAVGRREVVLALINAGCQEGEGYAHANIEWGLIGNGPKGIFYDDEIESFSELCGWKSRKITIEQLQGRAGASQERPGAWNGEGIPPVGTVCEATWGGKAEWMKAVILEHDSIPLFAAKISSEWLVIHRTYVSNAEFRPLQSEEQRQVAEIDAIIANYTSASGLELAQEIYNAGFRKEVSDGK